MHPVTRQTGPKTLEGKARSAANSLKHGLTSRHVVLPGEDRAEFEALAARLVEEHGATDTLEIEIVHEIAGCIWRLDRARKAESEYFHLNFIADKATKDTERRFALILRYTGTIERELHRAITRLQQLTKERAQPQQTKLTTENRQLTTDFVSSTRAPLATDHRPLTTELTTDNRQLTTHQIK